MIETPWYDCLDEHQVNEWVNCKYEPILSSIESTNQLFLNGELPYIKNIAQGDIDNTIKKVAKLISENIDKKKRVIFVSGCQVQEKGLIFRLLCYKASYLTKYDAL